MAWTITVVNGKIKIDNGLTADAKVQFLFPPDMFFPTIQGTHCEFRQHDGDAFVRIEFDDVTTAETEWADLFDTVLAAASTSLTGIVSSVNSSTATLIADAVFTGTAEDVSSFGSITVSYTSDVASALSGLSMEFSPDGTNWDRMLTGHLLGKTSDLHVLRRVNKYFRVVYTNGGTGQANFRLQVIYDPANALPLINRAGSAHGINDVIPVRPFTSIDLDFAREHVDGGRAFFFFGFNDAVGTSWEDIHPNGGDINWLTTAGTVEVVSSDAADTSAGLGVRSVEIHGLSATGADQDEVIIMNGVTPVVSSLSYIRINKMHSETCGTYGGSHQGDITCQVTGAGAVLSVMTGEEGAVDTAVVYGSGEAGNGYWTVPLGKVAYLTRLEVIPDVATNKTIDIALYEREDILDSSVPVAPRRVLWQESGVDTTTEKVFKSHIKIKALADIWFRAKASATSKIEVSCDFYLVDADADGQ